MPRQGQLTRVLSARIEFLIVEFFLPLYFCYSGLSTDITRLNTIGAWGMVVLMCALASFGKVVTCALCMRVASARFGWEEEALTLKEIQAQLELAQMNKTTSSSTASSANQPAEQSHTSGSTGNVAVNVAPDPPSSSGAHKSGISPESANGPSGGASSKDDSVDTSRSDKDSGSHSAPSVSSSPAPSSESAPKSSLWRDFKKYKPAPWNACIALGLLMNTRGLVALIVLNVGLDSGYLSIETFTVLLLMALITTFATSPLLYRVFSQKFNEGLQEAEAQVELDLEEEAEAELTITDEEGGVDVLSTSSERPSRSSRALRSRSNSRGHVGHDADSETPETADESHVVVSNPSDPTTAAAPSESVHPGTSTPPRRGSGMKRPAARTSLSTGGLHPSAADATSPSAENSVIIRFHDDEPHALQHADDEKNQTEGEHKPAVDRQSSRPRVTFAHTGGDETESPSPQGTGMHSPGAARRMRSRAASAADTSLRSPAHPPTPHAPLGLRERILAELFPAPVHYGPPAALVTQTHMLDREHEMLLAEMSGTDDEEEEIARHRAHELAYGLGGHTRTPSHRAHAPSIGGEAPGPTMLSPHSRRPSDAHRPSVAELPSYNPHSLSIPHTHQLEEAARLRRIVRERQLAKVHAMEKDKSNK
jgi:hypothetical protein